MRCRGRNKAVFLLALLIALSIFFETRVSGQVPSSDFYADVRVNMEDNAIAFYTVNITLGPRAVKMLKEADCKFKIQIPKWASPKLVYSTEMPALLLPDGSKIKLRLESGGNYDYLIAEMPLNAESINATIKIGFVQRDVIVGNSIGFKLPILTGFNILPEYVNFTLRTSGRIENYMQYLVDFNPIFENNTAVGLWNLYFRPTTVGDINGSIYFSKSFDKCVIESLSREIEVTEHLQVLVKDRLRVRYVGRGSVIEVLKASIPANISDRVRAKDSLGPLQKYSDTFTGSNISTVRIYSRYLLDPGREYEAIVEYDIPIKNIPKSTSGNTISILIRDLANYSDIVNTYSLSVKAKSLGNWKIVFDSTTLDLEKDGVFIANFTNAMPDLLIQPVSIIFTYSQIEAGKSISIILGILTLAILLVIDIFRGKTIPVEETKEKKEIESIIERMIEALNEKIDYESRLEEIKVKNTLGKISSREYKTSVEEYERRITGAEKRIIKVIEQISLKNPKVGEEVKRNYDVFEEIDNDLRKMIDNTIEKFRSGRITRSVFENLAKKYLKDNRKRREAATEDIYKTLGKLGQ